jgi:hypothetical protein
MYFENECKKSGVKALKIKTGSSIGMIHLIPEAVIEISFPRLRNSGGKTKIQVKNK